YTTATIRERLTMRNFMEELRSAGIETGGPNAFSQGDRQAFANQLDRFLAKIPVA
ncbi:MAG: YaiI/YqxD family protein, partial [Dechloromonas sp.]